jgi:predicted nucleic acid-binding protein
VKAVCDTNVLIAAFLIEGVCSGLLSRARKQVFSLVLRDDIIKEFKGVLTFTGYLLFDFNRLQKKARHLEANTWSSALDMALSLCLDVINLYLDLFDLLSK